MKKLIVAIAFSLISLGLSAQDWAVGARLGATAQVVGQYDMGAPVSVPALPTIS